MYPDVLGMGVHIINLGEGFVRFVLFLLGLFVILARVLMGSNLRRSRVYKHIRGYACSARI